MALPERFSLTINQGETLKRWFAVRLPNGTVANLPTQGSGYTIGRLYVRNAYGGDLLLALTTTNGGIVLGLMTDSQGQQWSGYIYAPASATAALTPWGNGVYDFEISDGSDVIRVAQGDARLSREATT